jgi:general secretion pathway protein G
MTALCTRLLELIPLISKRKCQQRGMTLLELMLAVAILGVLSTISVASYKRYVDRMKVNTAIADIGQIQLVINKYRLDRDAFPPTLADCGLGGKLDPWGNPYEYLDFTGLKGNGMVRKDRNLVPINSDYDLYSKGPDGDSRTPLTAKASRDDIVRANDGAFIGKAEDY